MTQSVLIVDDMPAPLQSLVAILENMDFEIITASSFEEAEVKLQYYTFAVAIVDLALKKDFHVQGLKLIQLIKKQSPRTGIILVTAYPGRLIEQPNVEALFLRGDSTESYPHLKYSLIKEDNIIELRNTVQNLAERFIEN